MEIVATKAQRDALGLSYFVDGNLGVVMQRDGACVMYGANGSKPFRVVGVPDAPFQKADPVTISTEAGRFGYLSGGPVYHDSSSGRLLLFYHAEIHRGSEKNFYTVLGLAIQTDQSGVVFKDTGPIFQPNVSENEAKQSVEICGAPYVIKDGYFYVYGRDKQEGWHPTESNLSVVRANVKEVVRCALKGQGAVWKKYYSGEFSEPALGGRSSSLEKGNPGTRWMDVTYNTALRKFVMVVAANTTAEKARLFIVFSDDGVHWSKRSPLTHDEGECFYPSIVGFRSDSRETGNSFYIYYTFSQKGGWERWSDAEVVRRKITVQGVP